MQQPTPKTALFGRWIGGQLQVIDQNLTTGNVFFVGSAVAGATDSAGYGKSPEAPFATIDFAVGQCTANNGDLILVLPGHVETIIAAGGLDLDVAGITIRGIGNGRLRPKVTFTTATTADMDVDAANITIENLFFDCVSLDAVAAPIDVNAANFTMRHCEMELANGSAQATVGVTADANADRLLIEDCHFHGTSDAGTTSAITVAGADDVTIRNNVILGAHATNGSIENSAAALNFNVLNNYILNRTADGNNKTIVLHASTTGLIANNRGGIIDSTSPAPVTAAAAWVAGNYWSSAVGVAASTLM
jgi:hypothetical protein